MRQFLNIAIVVFAISLLVKMPVLAQANIDNGQITGFSPVQGSMVKKKIAGSAMGSECGHYLRSQSLRSGLNDQGKPSEKTLAIGIAPVSAAVDSADYVDSRYVAFREAWLVATAEMARMLESEVKTKASRKLQTGLNNQKEISEAEKAAGYRQQAEQLEAKQEKGQDDLGSAIKNGTRLLNVVITDELKKLGHDVDAERKAKNEQNAAKRDELLKKAAEAEEAQKRLVSSRAFKELIEAVALQQMKGIYSRFTNENLDPDGDKTLMCVVLQYSPKSERLADMMASRDFSNIPKLDPEDPLTQQLPDPSTPDGVFQLVTSWGMTVLIDENGDVNLVAYGQAGFENGDENQEIAAKESAKLRAEGLIRLFINQTVSVQQATGIAQDVKTFTDKMKTTKLTKESQSALEQGGDFLPINGMTEIVGWAGIHPVNNWGIAGSVVAWNASQAAGALQSKERQNKVVKDTGGIIKRNDTGQQNAPASSSPRRGGLKGSTRSKDF